MKRQELKQLLEEYDTQKSSFRRTFNTRSRKIELLAEFIEEKCSSDQANADFTFEELRHFAATKNVTLDIFSDDPLSNIILRKWFYKEVVNIHVGPALQIPSFHSSLEIAPIQSNVSFPNSNEFKSIFFANDPKENSLFRSDSSFVKHTNQHVNLFRPSQQNLSVNDIANIRKAARIIAQGTRDSGSLFSKLPHEIGTMIAAHCSDGSLCKPIADFVAQRHFGRPKI